MKDIITMSATTTTTTAGHDAPAAPEGRTPSTFWRTTLTVLLVGALAGLLYATVIHEGGVKGAWKSLNDLADSTHEKAPVVETPVPVIRENINATWDELVKVNEDEQEAIGFRYAEVKAQTDPIRLELNGRTEYDTNTITKVRPRFDTRVEQVYATIGQKVKKGDPLVELYSTDLAAAKTDFQTKYVQWQHDVKLYKLREKLVSTGAISQQLWVDTQNDEQKSRLDYNIARDKLTVFYEVPEDELNPLLERIGNQAADADKFGTVTSKAKMTLRSKADGYVIKREVVPSNYYESTDTLMEIAPLDHLWVWVNVYELDQDKVRLGQTIEIQFPFLEETIKGHVDYVASEVSKETRAVRVRAFISNPDARLKSDMLLRAYLEIPPLPGQTVIPRLAMVASSGGEYVFVRKAREDKKPEGADPKKDKVDRFERVKIRIAQENTDNVIVADGLKAGDTIVTNGSLIVSQLYEDQRMTTTGLPNQ
jgi:membrane fusion protein, heavy metal efflux system